MILKVTDPAYSLPELTALELLREFGTGANKPVLMRCVDNQLGEQVEVVVKLKDGKLSPLPAPAGRSEHIWRGRPSAGARLWKT